MPIGPNAPLGLPASPLRPLVKPMFRTLAVAASGLSAQRARMETIAGNIANAEVTRTPEGGPYRRQVVQLGTAPAPVPLPALPELPPVLDSGAFPVPFTAPSAYGSGITAPDAATGVQVTGIVEDTSEGPLVYEPGHPDADANGYVRYPNVRITDEMVDLMDARRVFEANATVFQSAKQMLRRAIDI
ncbi:MAG TPA: flagellar basal body rod protein FlgC [Gemmatimonadaceae bacterium]|nr:flagellar basal body rod protein FlgC [Gemmatimonadaceae bacterium]